MLFDAHAHLNDDALTPFLENLGARENQDSIVVVSNSIDYKSSLSNLRLRERMSGVRPFVGIHPEVFGKTMKSELNKIELDSEILKIEGLLPRAEGVGEIGIDPKYGNIVLQEYLCGKMLDLAESAGLPVTIHSRNSVSRMLELLSTRHIRGKILFHWFAGTEPELKRIQDQGMFVSFGPSIIFSKRLGALAASSATELLLPETDAPTEFEGIAKNSPGTPFLVSSVVFKIALLRNTSFENMLEITSENGMRYLQTQD